jgi:uncharacterized membrane protein YdjX (TVP38/TMEM64 family)
MKLPKTPTLILLAVLAAMAGFVAWKMGWVDWALSMKEPVLGWCRSNPVALFAAIAILPGLGFPASPLLILAGAVWGSDLGSCFIAIAATALNMTWTYAAAAGPARRIIARLLGTRWDRWRDMDRRNLLKLTLLLRITPGVPLVIQNYTLGLLAVPFVPYLLISVPINGLFVTGFVLTGGAIFEGSLGAAIAGVSILIAASIAVKMIRRRLAAAR